MAVHLLSVHRFTSILSSGNHRLSLGLARVKLSDTLTLPEHNP